MRGRFALRGSWKANSALLHPSYVSGPAALNRFCQQLLACGYVDDIGGGGQDARQGGAEGLNSGLNVDLSQELANMRGGRVCRHPVPRQTVAQIFQIGAANREGEFAIMLHFDPVAPILHDPVFYSIAFLCQTADQELCQFAGKDAVIDEVVMRFVQLTGGGFEVVAGEIVSVIMDTRLLVLSAPGYCCIGAKMGRAE